MAKKFSEPYKICNNCNGNGYVRTAYFETKNCSECKGAGHFDEQKVKIKPKSEDSIDTNEMLKLIKLIEDFIRDQRTVH